MQNDTFQVHDGQSFAVVDVETATSDNASICQIGIVQCVDGRCVDRWSSLVNPEMAFDEFNILLHGISDETVRHAPRLSELLPGLRRRLEKKIVGCHTMFDRNAFEAACRLLGEPILDVRWLDTASVVRKTWTQFSRRGYKLDNIANYLGIPLQHHDALEDAHAAAQVLLRAIEKTGLSADDWYLRGL